MDQKPRVFVEPSVMQHSVRSRRLLRPRAEQPEWMGEQILYDLVEEDPTACVKGDGMRVEVGLLPRIAEAAKRGDIELLSHMESVFEYLGVHRLGDGPSTLLQAGVAWVKDPVPYSRIIAGPSFGDARALRADFLKGLRHGRFLELQRACGAHRGSRAHENQLADAFHIWCAEEGGATHFLTTDLKLIRVFGSQKETRLRVEVVAPSGLLRELGHAIP